MVYLRQPSIDDEKEFLGKVRKSREFHRGLMRLARNHKEFEAFVARTRSSSTEGSLICRNCDDVIVGVISLSQIFYGPLKSAYLGYSLFKGFTGCGYATEAVRLIVRFSFKDLKLHRVEANIQPDNLASIALVKRLGFSREGFSPKYLKIGGRWRDHERWALIKENWKKKL